MSIIQGISKSSEAGYSIDQSIRFNDDDSAYLTRTPSSEGNRRTFTFSTWVKFANLKADTILFSSWVSSGASSYQILVIDSDFRMRVSDHSANYLITTQKFRDVGAWYHVVWRADTTDSTAADRYQLYINGERVTAFDTESQPSLNFQGSVNQTQPHYLGRNGYSLAMIYSDLYQAETHFIDGTALDCNSFGEFDSDTGQWIPKKYTNAAGHGTNGFHITGGDSSDLGADQAGSNNFSSSGLTSADQRNDSPSLNKATLNPLNTGSNQTLSDGNLTVVNGSSTGTLWNRSNATQVLTYKTYWEVQITSYYAFAVGLNPNGVNPPNNINNGAGNTGVALQRNEVFIQGSYANESSGGVTFPISNGDYLMFCYDPDRNALWAGNEGTWKDGTSSSASSSTILAEIEGTGTSYAIFTGIGADPVPFIAMYASNTGTARFSSEDFEGSIPTGFEQLAPSALPDPSIPDPSLYFQSVQYATSTSAQDITFGGNSDLAPDWLWFKSRSTASDHFLFDKVRGVLKTISSNDANPEVTSAGSLTAFGSDGFSLGDGGSDNDINGASSSANFMAWGWAAGNSSGSSNGDGSTSSTVSANSTSGFSITKWTGTGSATTLGHGLGSVPKMIWVKNLNDADSWVVYHEDVGNTKGLTLDGSGTPTTASTFFNNTTPTSSVFTVGSGGRTNGTSDGMIALVFGEVPGYSKISSYVGNGSTDGTFVDVGFKPTWLLIRRTDAGASWEIADSIRDPSNPVTSILQADTVDAEWTATSKLFDFVSNGFKHRSSHADFNASGGTYIYMAFAESPFKTATAR